MDFDQMSLSHANTSIYTSYSQNEQNNDLITEAIQLAINIFDEYIKKGAETYIPLPINILQTIYDKFGIPFFNEKTDFENST
jgi:hypothetical protein